MENEIWKPINGLIGYEVSNLGAFRSINRIVKCKRGGTFNFKGRLLKQSLKKDGYLRVVISINGKSKHYSSHRLVAKTFINNPLNKKEVNHINSIRNDNRVCNLEWVTPSENLKHSYDNGNREKKFYGYKPNKIRFNPNRFGN
jgi:hypothetical protein